MRSPLVGDLSDHILRFTHCKDLEILSTTDDIQIFATRTKSAMRSRDVKIQIFNKVTFGR